MILYNKVLGLFRMTPLHPYSMGELISYTEESKETIQPILDKLRKEGKIKGKVKFKLAGELLKIAKSRL